MNKKWVISYHDYGQYLTQFTDMLTKYIKHPELLEGVYGPPRGGLPIATHISHHFNTNLILNLEEYIQGMWMRVNVAKDILIVDDICDSGRTFSQINKFLELDSEIVNPIFAAIFVKPRSFGTFYLEERCIKMIDNDVWMVFPWEKDETPDKDYMI